MRQRVSSVYCRERPTPGGDKLYVQLSFSFLWHLIRNIYYYKGEWACVSWCLVCVSLLCNFCIISRSPVSVIFHCQTRCLHWLSEIQKLHRKDKMLNAATSYIRRRHFVLWSHVTAEGRDKYSCPIQIRCNSLLVGHSILVNLLRYFTILKYFTWVFPFNGFPLQTNTTTYYTVYTTT